MRRPVRRRLPKQPPLPIHPVAGPPGVFGLDLGELFFQVTLRELLEREGIGPGSKMP